MQSYNIVARSVASGSAIRSLDLLMARMIRPADCVSTYVSRNTPTLYYSYRQLNRSLYTTGYVTQTTASLRRHSFRSAPTLLHTTDYQPRLSPRHKHSKTNSEPRHFKARHSMNRPPNFTGSTITPGVSRPTASSLICFYPLATPNRQP